MSLIRLFIAVNLICLAFSNLAVATSDCDDLETTLVAQKCEFNEKCGTYLMQLQYCYTQKDFAQMRRGQATLLASQSTVQDLISVVALVRAEHQFTPVPLNTLTIPGAVGLANIYSPVEVDSAIALLIHQYKFTPVDRADLNIRAALSKIRGN
ncbi:MAG: hypothetical protein AABZ55_14060 [Bdellovibrionota bacterium]